MRRIALACLCLALSGCGYDTWWNAPFTSGSNPHFPAGDSENMRRVMGQDVQVPALTTEPGDIWPGPLPPEPTLQELEQQTGEQPATEQPVPGSPLFNQPKPPSPPPELPRGSSTTPGSNQPPLAPIPAPRGPSVSTPVTPPPAAPQPGQIVTTPSGPGVTSGGTSGYQTLTVPGGGSAIVVPNGNGTSTVIYPNGKIETVPTPR